MEEFKGRTENKSDLFEELKRMDENLKQKKPTTNENEKRLEMYRKVRKDIELENREEKE